MSDEAHKEIVEILLKINRKFEIVSATWGTDSKTFEAKIRTQIPKDNEDFNSLCDEWVDIFSEVTNTVWVKTVSNTGPKIRFRKQYQCWTQGGKVIQKELLFDLRRCKASLDIKVLTENPQTKNKNKYARMGLNVLIRLFFQHLHPVDTTQPCAFFVHNCEPLPEVPKPNVQVNSRLPELVAAMVQNGPYISKKVAERVEKTILDKIKTVQKIIDEPKDEPLKETRMVENCDKNQLQDSLRLAVNQESLMTTTIQNMEPVKFNNELHFQQCAQFIVSSPQIDDQLLMYPLVFDTSQVIMLNQNPTSVLHLVPKENIN